jgi:hypothetical protein
MQMTKKAKTSFKNKIQLTNKSGNSNKKIKYSNTVYCKKLCKYLDYLMS